MTLSCRPLPPADYLRDRFEYDPATGALTLRSTGKPTGSATASGHVVTSLGSAEGHRLAYVHRIVWKMQTGQDADGALDHANGSPADNRWSNLRLDVGGGNSQNCKGKSRSGLPKGVNHHGSGYRARAMAQGVLHNLGTYRTPEEAKAAYDAFASLVHDQFFRSA